MDGLILFLVLALLQVFVLYRIGRLLFWRRPLEGFLEFCIAIPATIGVTAILLTAIGYVGSLIHIPIDLGLALLLSVVGIPLLYIVLFLLVFRGLKYGRKLIAGFLKQRRLQHQFTVARRFIHQHQYQKAQAILSTISDSKARQWEIKLNQLMLHHPSGLQQSKR